jgi:Tol biopolymer transport system component
MHLRDHHLGRGAIALLVALAALAAVAAATAATGTTERVSVSGSGSQANGGTVGRPAISADGNLVAFASAATNLVPGVTSGQDNVYARNRSTGATVLISVTPKGSEPNGSSSNPDVSADGRYVAFQTNATNLVPGVNAGGIVVFDTATGTTTLASVAGKSKPASGSSENPSISDDGRYVAFQSNDPSLAQGLKPSGNPPYIYVRDLVAQKTLLASVNSAGKPVGNFSENPVISGNGRYVAFQSANVDGTINGTSDVFVHDLQTGSTTLVSVDSAGNPANRGDATDPSISSDGRYIAFDAAAQTLVPNDTNSAQDVFVHDMLTGQTARVSVDSAGNQANGSSDLVSTGPEISADGSHVTFDSAATNLVAGDTNTCTLDVYNFPAAGQCPDVFVHDLQTGTTTRVSVDSNGNQADGWSNDPAIDADGSAVAFLSNATNLVPNDTNGAPDTFVHAG